MKIKWSLIFLMLMGTSLNAQDESVDLVSLGSIKALDKTIFLYKGNYEERESLVVFDGSEAPGNFFVSDSAAHPLKRVSPLQFPGSDKVYILSIWGKGAHGETVRVLDPARSNMELMSFNSAWPVQVEVKDAKLVIHGKGGAVGDKTEEYEDLNYTWSP